MSEIQTDQLLIPMKRFAWIPEPLRGYLRLPLIRYRLRQKRKTSLNLVRSLNVRLSHTPEYEEYLINQITRSWKMRSHIARNRVANLVNSFLEHDKQERKNRSVLCVGCRNAHELGIFREAGFENVLGMISLAQMQPSCRWICTPLVPR